MLTSTELDRAGSAHAVLAPQMGAGQAAGPRARSRRGSGGFAHLAVAVTVDRQRHLHLAHSACSLTCLIAACSVRRVRTDARRDAGSRRTPWTSATGGPRRPDRRRRGGDRLFADGGWRSSCCLAALRIGAHTPAPPTSGPAELADAVVLRRRRGAERRRERSRRGVEPSPFGSRSQCSAAALRSGPRWGAARRPRPR